MTNRKVATKSRSGVLIFSKVPKLNYVKTRLQTSLIDEQDVLKLYHSFLKDTIYSSSKSTVYATILSVGGLENSSEPAIDESSPFNIVSKSMLEVLDQEMLDHIYDKVHIQKNGSFGDRMKEAIQWCFQDGFEKLIILGADSPNIQPSVITKSLEKLDEYDIIIGPSAVGGIYLIGINSDFQLTGFEDIFEGVELSNLAKLASQNDMKGYFLPELTDIDIEEDLVGLIAWIDGLSYLGNKQNMQIPEYTKKIIENLGIKIRIDRNNNRKKTLYKNGNGH